MMCRATLLCLVWRWLQRGAPVRLRPWRSVRSPRSFKSSQTSTSGVHALIVAQRTKDLQDTQENLEAITAKQRSSERALREQGEGLSGAALQLWRWGARSIDDNAKRCRLSFTSVSRRLMRVRGCTVTRSRSVTSSRSSMSTVGTLTGVMLWGVSRRRVMIKFHHGMDARAEV